MKIFRLSAIGDPLIQGLREIVKERPMSPVKFLANFLIQYEQQKNSAALIVSQL
jgi:Dpy-30 motif.